MNKLMRSLLILLIYSGNTLFANNVCDDWQTYKDEKCLKVIGSVQSYEEAVNSCTQYNSTLVTIASLDEQHFIENYLFATLKLVENVWTGLRFISGKYKWINDFDANYTNWSEHSPKNNSELCTQISSDEITLGKWSDILCTKKNLALCQKFPTLTMQLLMSILTFTRQLLENTVSQQENTSKQLLATNTKLDSTQYTLNSTNIRLEKTTKQLDYFFSNKWINFRTFVENNTRKALIYPFKSQSTVSRTDAIEICKLNNATLVDIESLDKQKIVESFLYQFNPKLEYADYFIGAYYESSSGKHKWFNSGNEFTYTNWAATNGALTNPFAIIHNGYEGVYFGKWYTVDGPTPRNVICEISFII